MEEYKALRAEMLKWQDRRFDLMKMSSGLITALLGLKLVLGHPAENEIWPLVSSVLLLFLSGANFLSWYAGIANSKLAGYIKVFYEGDVSNYRWEGRLKKLKDKGLDPENLNKWITFIYVALAVISVAVPFAGAKFSFRGIGAYTLLPFSGVLFLVSAFIVLRFPNQRQRYEEHWQEIKEEEKQSAKSKQLDRTGSDPGGGFS